MSREHRAELERLQARLREVRGQLEVSETPTFVAAREKLLQELPPLRSTVAEACDRFDFLQQQTLEAEDTLAQEKIRLNANETRANVAVGTFLISTLLGLLCFIQGVPTDSTATLLCPLRSFVAITLLEIGDGHKRTQRTHRIGQRRSTGTFTDVWDAHTQGWPVSHLGGTDPSPSPQSQPGFSRCGTSWLAWEPTGVPWHQRFARDTIPQASLFRLRRPGRVQSDSTGATPRKGK